MKAYAMGRVFDVKETVGLADQIRALKMTGDDVFVETHNRAVELSAKVVELHEIQSLRQRLEAMNEPESDDEIEREDLRPRHPDDCNTMIRR